MRAMDKDIVLDDVRLRTKQQSLGYNMASPAYGRVYLYVEYVFNKTVETRELTLTSHLVSSARIATGGTVLGTLSSVWYLTVQSALFCRTLWFRCFAQIPQQDSMNLIPVVLTLTPLQSKGQ